MLRAGIRPLQDEALRAATRHVGGGGGGGMWVWMPRRPPAPPPAGVDGVCGCVGVWYACRRGNQRRMSCLRGCYYGM